MAVNCLHCVDVKVLFRRIISVLIHASWAGFLFFPFFINEVFSIKPAFRTLSNASFSTRYVVCF